MLSRVLVALLIFAAGAGAAWYYKSIVSISEVPSATASNPRGGGGRAVQVVAARVRVGTVSDSFQAIGTANANEAVTITTKIAGLIKSVNFEEGGTAKRGQVLVELDDREARASLAVTAANLRNARLLYDRAQQLVKSNNIPVAKVDELLSSMQAAESLAEAAKARLADLQILAPFDGRLGLRRVSPGTLVTQNAAITTLDDTSVIKMDFSVPEVLLSKINVATIVAARNDINPERKFEGKVATINSRIDPITRAVEVRALVPNADNGIRPGSLMTVDLILTERSGAMLISEAALVPEGADQFVYKIADNRAVRTQVRIGIRKQGEVEILEGLKEGEQVIVGGAQKVRNGTRVQVTQDSIAEG